MYIVATERVLAVSIIIIHNVNMAMYNVQPVMCKYMYIQGQASSQSSCLGWHQSAWSNKPLHF